MCRNKYSNNTRKMHKYSNRNRRATNHRSHLALIPLEKLFSDRGDILVFTPKSSSEYVRSGDPFEHAHKNPVVVSLSQCRSDLDHPL